MAQRKTSHPKRVKKPFDSKKINPWELWTLPLWILGGLKAGKTLQVNMYELASMMGTNENLYEVITYELERYAHHVNPRSPDAFLTLLNTGIHEDYPSFNELQNITETLYTKSGMAFDLYNITRCLYLGSHGKNWYSEATQTFKEMLPDYDIETFIKIFALTSPVSDLRTNLEKALKAYDVFYKGKKKFKGFLPNIDKMLNELKRGEFSFEKVSPSSRPKVVSFAKTLLGDTEAVVIDSKVMHATGLARVYTWEHKEHTVTVTRTEYKLVSEYIKILAKTAGYEPRQVVAMLWTGQKMLNPRHRKINVSEVLQELLIEN